jgi:hypothetical protein
MMRQTHYAYQQNSKQKRDFKSALEKLYNDTNSVDAEGLSGFNNHESDINFYKPDITMNNLKIKNRNYIL